MKAEGSPIQGNACRKSAKELLEMLRLHVEYPPETVSALLSVISERRLVKGARYCSIDSDGITITFTPSANRGSEGFFYLNERKVSVPANAVSKHIGEALMQAFEASE